MNRITALASTLVFWLLAVTPSAQAASYTFTQILHGTAYGINNSGVIAGTNLSDAQHPYGWVLTGGSLRRIDHPSATGTLVQGINNAGEVAGYYYDANGHWRGFVEQDGAFTPVDYPSATTVTTAMDINDSGQVVGYYFDPTGCHGFQYTDGSFITLIPPGVTAKGDGLIESYAVGLNDNGQVVGYYWNSSGYHGYVYNGSFTTIDFPGASGTYAWGINNDGEVVGHYLSSTGFHGFVYSGGAFETIDYPGAQGTYVHGINDGGKLVGIYSEPGKWPGYGFLASPAEEPPTLEITTDLPPNSKGVEPGATFTYNLHMTCSSLDATEVLLVNPVPDGTTLVAGSISGGGWDDGDRITWSFDDCGDRESSFQLKVKEIDSLPRGLKKITDRASLLVKRPGGNLTCNARHSVRLLLAGIITGVVRDVVVDFPKTVAVVLRKPVEDATVLILDGSGSQVSSVKTDSTGAFTVDDLSPDTYTVKVQKPVNQYMPGSKTIAPDARFIWQEQQATINADQIRPVQLEFQLPVSLVNRTVDLIHSLNHLEAVVPGTISDLMKLLGYPLAFSYSTGDSEAVLENVAQACPEFKGVYNGAGQRDDWNALIRLTAFLSAAERRFKECAVLGDDFSKSISLFITIQTVQTIMKKLPQTFPAATLNQVAAERLKVGVMAFGVGQALPWALNQLDLSGPTKARIIESTAKILRYGFDLVTKNGKALTSDLIFETVFNLLRLGLYESYLTVYMNDTQKYLDSAASLAARRIIAADTTEALKALDAYDSKVADRTDQVHDASVRAMKNISVVRGLDGLLGKTAQILTLGNGEGWGGTAVKKVLGFIAKPVQAATFTAYAVAAGGPLGEWGFRQRDLEIMSNLAFSGPVEAFGTEVEDGFEHHRALRELIPASSIQGARMPATRPEASAYIDHLATINMALEANSTKNYAQLAKKLKVVDKDLFDYMTPIFERGLAALPGVDTEQSGPIMTFLDAYGFASNMVGGFCISLEVWNLKKNEDCAAAATTALNLVQDAILSAADAAENAEQAMVGLAIPGCLIIQEGNWPKIVGGTDVVLDFKITNVGGATIDGGKASFNVSSNCRLLSKSSKPFPALEPGKSAKVSWKIAIPEVQDISFADYQVNALSSSVRSATEDTLLLFHQ